MNLLVYALITFIIGAVFQIPVLFKLAYFFLGFHILIKVYYYNIAQNLYMNHKLKDDHVFLNEDIEFEVEVENRGRLPILWVKILEVLPRKLIPAQKHEVTFLAPGETKKWSYSIKGKQRGLYYIGPLEVEAGDMLGYSISRGDVEKLPFYIFPRLLSLTELGLPSRLPFGDVEWPQPIYKDPYQMVGIREYQSSDSMKKIHWKATARTGRLQSRENQSTVSLQTAIVLNLSMEDYGLKWLDRKVERAITAAASIAYYLTRAGQPFSFVTNGINSAEKITSEKPVKSGVENSSDSKNYDMSANINGSLSDDVNGYSSDADDSFEEHTNKKGTKDFARNIRRNRGDKVKHPVGSGELHLQRVLETLACLEITKKDNFLDLLSGSFELSWGGTIIIFTDSDDDELIRVAEHLTTRGYSVKILLLGGGSVKHSKYLHRPFTASLSIHKLRKEEDIYGLS